MSSSAQPRISRPLLWASVAVAALFAFEIATAWIRYSDRRAHRGSFLNFHPLLTAVYAPLAFGLLWPILIWIISRAKHRGESLVWPAKTALVMFLLSLCCSTPLVVLEYRSYMRGLESVSAEQSRISAFHDRQLLEQQKALSQLQVKGVQSLAEPLTGPQIDAVNSYLDAHSQSQLQLEDAVRHYRTSLPVMQHLAASRYCPGPVLELIFNNITDLQDNSSPSLQAVNPYQVLYDLAWNPNTPLPVLVRMLENPDPKVREAVAANPRLPADTKTSYLKKAATSQSFSERKQAAGNEDSSPDQLSRMLDDENFRVRQAAAANPNTPKPAKMAYFRKTAFSDMLWDRILAAESPDCPPDVLRKLALDPATSKYVASNPASPTDLLQTLSHSDDPETCRRAVANLTQRQKQVR